MHLPGLEWNRAAPHSLWRRKWDQLHIFQFLAAPSQERSVQTLQSQFADVGVKNQSSHTVWDGKETCLKSRSPETLSS